MYENKVTFFIQFHFRYILNDKNIDLLKTKIHEKKTNKIYDEVSQLCWSIFIRIVQTMK